VTLTFQPTRWKPGRAFAEIGQETNGSLPGWLRDSRGGLLAGSPANNVLSVARCAYNNRLRARAGKDRGVYQRTTPRPRLINSIQHRASHSVRPGVRSGATPTGSRRRKNVLKSWSPVARRPDCEFAQVAQFDQLRVDRRGIVGK
jgi:hypothetical protein